MKGIVSTWKNVHGLSVLNAQVSDGESLEALLLVHDAHGGEHVVLESVGSVQLKGGLCVVCEWWWEDQVKKRRKRNTKKERV